VAAWRLSGSSYSIRWRGGTKPSERENLLDSSTGPLSWVNWLYSRQFWCRVSPAWSFAPFPSGCPVSGKEIRWVSWVYYERRRNLMKWSHHVPFAVEVRRGRLRRQRVGSACIARNVTRPPNFLKRRRCERGRVIHLLGGSALRGSRLSMTVRRRCACGQPSLSSLVATLPRLRRCGIGTVSGRCRSAGFPGLPTRSPI
jgi:hypothetical protein